MSRRSSHCPFFGLKRAISSSAASQPRDAASRKQVRACSLLGATPCPVSQHSPKLNKQTDLLQRSHPAGRSTPSATSIRETEDVRNSEFPLTNTALHTA